MTLEQAVDPSEDHVIIIIIIIIIMALMDIGKNADV